MADTGFSDRTSTVWALALYLDASWPRTWPFTWDVEPLRVSTDDVVPDGTSLGSVLFAKRILDAPIVTSSQLDEFGTVVQGEQLRFRLTARTSGGVDLHTWVAAEHRGKRVDGWLLDRDPTTLAVLGATQVFTGSVLSMADDPASVDVLVRVYDVYTLKQSLPISRVDTSWAPYAPAAGLGQVVAHGRGVGRRVRCHPVRARSQEDTLIEYTAVATAATDLLTVLAGYDWVTGDGPVKLVSTGTPPGGLAADTDYFVIVVDDVTLRLATTRGNAMENTFVDITSAGTGTHTLSNGLAPNTADFTDFVVGVGNIAVCAVWIDGETETPEWPHDYRVLNQEYRAGGRYLTVIRIPGEWADSAVEADVLRVDSDVLGDTLMDIKFARGFQDDARDDSLPVLLTDTSALRQGYHRFGFGAFAPNPSAGAGFSIPPVVQVPVRTVHVYWTAPRTINDSELYDDGGVALAWNATTQLLTLTVYYPFQPGDPASGETVVTVGGVQVTRWVATTSLLRGATADIYVIVDHATGLIQFVVNGLSADVHSKLGPATAFTTSTPTVQPVAGVFHRLRVDARVISSDEVEEASWLWLRNGISWMVELLQTAGQQVDHFSGIFARANWSAVENNQLVVDGWMTQETELRAAVLAIAKMRGVRLSFIASGVTITVPTATPPAGVPFGHGDALGNLSGMPQRVRASATEAPREIVVRFRRERAGQVSDYAMSIRRPVFAAGDDVLTVELPFVDSPTSADIVCDWLQKRYLDRDQMVRSEAGHAALQSALGQVATLAVPAMGIAWNAELVTLERSTTRQAIGLVPWTPAPFTYTQAPLPADPIAQIFDPVFIGDAPLIRATREGDTIRIEVTPSSRLRDVRPTGDAGVGGIAGVAVNTTHMSGAPASAPWYAEVDDPVGSIDNDASGIRSTRSVFDGVTSTFVALFTWDPIDLALPIISVSVTADARAGAVVEQINAVGINVVIDPRYSSAANSVPADTTYRAYGKEVVPLLGAPWTAALVNSTALGYITTQKQDVYVTRVRRSIQYRVEVTKPVRVRYYRVGPSASQPDFPTEAAAPLIETFDFAPQVDTPGATGSWWYFVRVFDGAGRLVALLGPVSFDVA